MKIEYPVRETEAEIQAMLWVELKGLKLDARLNIHQRMSRCHLDIVVFNNKQEAACIIECKSWSKSYVRNRKYRLSHNTRQIKKYERTFGIPVLVCGVKTAIKPVAQIVSKLCYKSSLSRK